MLMLWHCCQASETFQLQNGLSCTWHHGPSPPLGFHAYPDFSMSFNCLQWNVSWNVFSPIAGQEKHSHYMRWPGVLTFLVLSWWNASCYKHEVMRSAENKCLAIHYPLCIIWWLKSIYIYIYFFNTSGPNFIHQIRIDTCFSINKSLIKKKTQPVHLYCLC